MTEHADRIAKRFNELTKSISAVWDIDNVQIAQTVLQIIQFEEENNVNIIISTAGNLNAVAGK
jgi:hypothetical protein